MGGLLSLRNVKQIAVETILFTLLSLPFAAGRPSAQESQQTPETAAQTTSIDSIATAATETISIDTQAATSTTAVPASASVSIDEFADFRASIDTTYRAKGESRVPDRKELKPWKKYIPAVYFESIFMDRDMYIIIHTSEHCINKRGKVICLNEEQLLNVLKRNRSAHYMVGESCKIYRIVGAEDAANAVGQSVWNSQYAMNTNTMNVEVQANVQGAISRTPNKEITSCQYRQLKNLTAMIMADFKIPAHRVLGHNQIALAYKYKTRQRKGDPGLNFDWSAIGLPNNYALVDLDMVAGRARNTSDKFLLKHRLLPGQICAERGMPDTFAKVGPKNNLDIADVSYCSTTIETAMKLPAGFLPSGF